MKLYFLFISDLLKQTHAMMNGSAESVILPLGSLLDRHDERAEKSLEQPFSLGLGQSAPVSVAT